MKRIIILFMALSLVVIGYSGCQTSRSGHVSKGGFPYGGTRPQASHQLNEGRQKRVKRTYNTFR